MLQPFKTLLTIYTTSFNIQKLHFAHTLYLLGVMHNSKQKGHSFSTQH